MLFHQNSELPTGSSRGVPGESCPLNAVAVRSSTPFVNWKRKERDPNPQVAGGETEARVCFQSLTRSQNDTAESSRKACCLCRTRVQSVVLYGDGFSEGVEPSPGPSTGGRHCPGTDGQEPEAPGPGQAGSSLVRCSATGWAIQPPACAFPQGELNAGLPVLGGRGL